MAQELRKHRGGYNRRARAEHPDVKVVKRGGRYVLRFYEPVAGGPGRVRQEALYAADGSPITSRDRASQRAREKSEELAAERARIAAGARPTNRRTSWSDLKQRHDEHLQAGGASPKSFRAYAQAWQRFEEWGNAPSLPAELRVEHLSAFVAHLRSAPSRARQGHLARHTVACYARHLRAILNFGRKVLHCVRLDAESINEGLRAGKLPRLLPASYDPDQLRAILAAAAEHDAAWPRSQVRPLLYFLMVVGCRISEAESLRWTRHPDPAAHEGWVDLEAGNIVLFGHKTLVQRVVPLAVRPQLVELLKGMRSRVDVRKEPYVFGGPLPLAVTDKRREPAPDGVIGRSLKSAIAAVQKAVDFHWNLHGLRKNLATYMANSTLGRNLYTLAGELGHDYQVLVKHYAGRRQLTAEQQIAGTVEALLGIERAG